jgi:hypothetical protein
METLSHVILDITVSSTKSWLICHVVGLDFGIMWGLLANTCIQIAPAYDILLQGVLCYDFDQMRQNFKWME